MKRLKAYLSAAPATAVLILLCTIVFLMIQFHPFVQSDSGMAVLLGAYYKPFLLAGEFWRTLTVGFVHVDFWHLLMNMYSLLNLGLLLERRYGTKFYLLLLVLSTIGGSLFAACASDAVLMVGLSGGLYGLMAAMLVMFYHLGLFRNQGFTNSVLRMIAINLLINFMPGVGVSAHIGGFVTGLLIGMALEDWRQGGTFKMNAWLAAVLLILSLGTITYTKVKVSEDRYYSFDLNILAVEQNLGMKSYAKKMAYKLDDLYGIDYMGSMVELMEKD